MTRRDRTAGLARAAVVVAAGAGLVWGATTQGVPALRDAPAAAERPGRATTRPVDESVLVCSGPDRLGVRGAPQPAPLTVSLVAPPRDVLRAAERVRAREGTASALGRATDAPGEVLSLTWEGGRLVRAGGQRAPGSAGQDGRASGLERHPVVVRGAQAMAPGLVAGTASLDDGHEARGLALAPCVLPRSDSVLVGGAREAGRSEYLVLSNPGTDPVTADIEVLGRGSGVRESITVPADGRVVRLVDALAPEVDAPAVVVHTRRGRLAAHLGSVVEDGVTLRGTDTTSTAVPATVSVVPAAPSSGRAVLRLVVPGPAPATVRIEALTPGGPRPLTGAGGAHRVGAGRTAEVTVDEVPEGTRAFRVSSDQPVAAAVRLQGAVDEAGEDVSDLAWVPAPGPLEGLAGAVVPDRLPGLSDAHSRLHLAAEVAGAATVHVLDREGVTREEQVDLGAGEATSLDLDDAVAVWVRPTGAGLSAAVVTRGRAAGVIVVGASTLTSTPTVVADRAVVPLP